MKQNKILWLVVGVLFIFSISGCQSTPSPAPTQQVLPTTGSYPASTAAATPTTGSYPGLVAPANPTAASYPVPSSSVTPAVGAYPSPQSGSSTIAWTDAEQYILNGDVTQIVQTKSLDVTLTLKNGKTIKTTAPAADAVNKAMTSCGNLCQNTSVTIQ